MEGSPPVDVELMVQHVERAGFAIQVEVGVLRQVDRGGLAGRCLDVELQLVVVCQHICCSHLQCAREAPQRGSLQTDVCVLVQMIGAGLRYSLVSGGLDAALELADSKSTCL